MACRENRRATVFRTLDLVETEIETVRRQFKPHDKVDLQMQWRKEDAARYLPVV